MVIWHFMKIHECSKLNPLTNERLLWLNNNLIIQLSSLSSEMCWRRATFKPVPQISEPFWFLEYVYLLLLHILSFQPFCSTGFADSFLFLLFVFYFWSVAIYFVQYSTTCWIGFVFGITVMNYRFVWMWGCSGFVPTRKEVGENWSFFAGLHLWKRGTSVICCTSIGNGMLIYHFGSAFYCRWKPLAAPPIKTARTSYVSFYKDNYKF